jgi:hypothetical protein
LEEIVEYAEEQFNKLPPDGKKPNRQRLTQYFMPYLYLVAKYTLEDEDRLLNYHSNLLAASKGTAYFEDVMHPFIVECGMFKLKEGKRHAGSLEARELQKIELGNGTVTQKVRSSGTFAMTFTHPEIKVNSSPRLFPQRKSRIGENP